MAVFQSHLFFKKLKVALSLLQRLFDMHVDYNLIVNQSAYKPLNLENGSSVNRGNLTGTKLFLI